MVLFVVLLISAVRCAHVFRLVFRCRFGRGVVVIIVLSWKIHPDVVSMRYKGALDSNADSDTRCRSRFRIASTNDRFAVLFGIAASATVVFPALYIRKR